jgi:hypothetical protein
MRSSANRSSMGYGGTVSSGMPRSARSSRAAQNLVDHSDEYDDEGHDFSCFTDSMNSMESDNTTERDVCEDSIYHDAVDLGNAANCDDNEELQERFEMQQRGVQLGMEDYPDLNTNSAHFREHAHFAPNPNSEGAQDLLEDTDHTITVNIRNNNSVTVSSRHDNGKNVKNIAKRSMGSNKSKKQNRSLNDPSISREGRHYAEQSNDAGVDNRNTNYDDNNYDNNTHDNLPNQNGDQNGNQNGNLPSSHYFDDSDNEQASDLSSMYAHSRISVDACDFPNDTTDFAAMETRAPLVTLGPPKQKKGKSSSSASPQKGGKSGKTTSPRTDDRPVDGSGTTAKLTDIGDEWIVQPNIIAKKRKGPAYTEKHPEDRDAHSSWCAFLCYAGYKSTANFLVFGCTHFWNMMCCRRKRMKKQPHFLEDYSELVVAVEVKTGGKKVVGPSGSGDANSNGTSGRSKNSDDHVAISVSGRDVIRSAGRNDNVDGDSTPGGTNLDASFHTKHYGNQKGKKGNKSSASGGGGAAGTNSSRSNTKSSGNHNAKSSGSSCSKCIGSSKEVECIELEKLAEATFKRAGALKPGWRTPMRKEKGSRVGGAAGQNQTGGGNTNAGNRGGSSSSSSSSQQHADAAAAGGGIDGLDEDQLPGLDDSLNVEKVLKDDGLGRDETIMPKTRLIESKNKNTVTATWQRFVNDVVVVNNQEKTERRRRMLEEQARVAYEKETGKKVGEGGRSDETGKNVGGVRISAARTGAKSQYSPGPDTSTSLERGNNPTVPPITHYKQSLISPSPLAIEQPTTNPDNIVLYYRYNMNNKSIVIYQWDWETHSDIGIPNMLRKSDEYGKQAPDISTFIYEFGHNMVNLMSKRVPLDGEEKKLN